MAFGHYDGDDVRVKGDDGTEDGSIITITNDGSKKRLDVSTGEIVVNVGERNTDLFDRVSMAEDSPLWSYTHRYNNDGDLYFDTDIDGSGTVTHDSNKSMRILTNGTASGNHVKYRTFRYFQYSKGRMQTFFFTMVPGIKQANVVKDFGALDDSDGLFFRLDGTGDAKLVIRSSTSGSVVDTEIEQTNWDDPMDGTGASGINIDWNKYHLFYISYAWLGGNSVEWGIFNNGVKTPIHRQGFLNAGVVPYCQTGNLPLSFEISNTGVASPAPVISISCHAVFNNGRQENTGEVFSVDSGTTEVNVNTADLVISAFRMTSTTNRASLSPVGFSLISPSGNSTIYYQVFIGGTFSGDSWSSVDKSIAEKLSAYTTYTNGFLLQSGYIKAGGENVVSRDISSNLFIGRDISGSSQPLVLVIRTISSTAKVLFSYNYREYK